MPDSSQLDDIQPPVSQVVTIQAGNKTSEICVSSTDHGKTPFSALRKKTQKGRKRRRQSSGELNAGVSSSSSFERGGSLQRKVDSIQRELDRCHETINQQNEQLAHYRTVLGEVQQETTSPLPASSPRGHSSSSSSALFPPTPPPHRPSSVGSSITGSLTPPDAGADTQQRAQHCQKRARKRDAKVTIILEDHYKKQKDLMENFRQDQNRILQSIRHDQQFS